MLEEDRCSGTQLTISFDGNDSTSNWSCRTIKYRCSYEMYKVKSCFSYSDLRTCLTTVSYYIKRYKQFKHQRRNLYTPIRITTVDGEVVAEGSGIETMLTELGM
jgi:hypothetical protein